MAIPKCRCAAVALAAALLSQPAAAAEQWLKMTTSHFELYTTAGERKGRDVLLYFEQVLDFFSRTRSGDKPAVNTRVRIIAFQSDKEYTPYRLNEFAAAFYLNGYEGDDYIVMKSISSENYPVAVHEYTHLMVQHSGLKVPPWLNEGLAELYSTLKPVGKKVEVGQLIPGRYYYLQQNKWLPLETLLTVDHRSPYYNERNRANIFYSESWALVHMLVLSPEYRPNVTKFLAAIGANATAPEAFQRAFGKTTAQVEKDLQAYMRRTEFNAVLFNVTLEKSAEEPDVSPAPPLESGVLLADLLALTHKPEEAKRSYTALAQQCPKAWEPEAGLAELAWRQKDLDSARTHFARAAELGCTNSRVYYHFAWLSLDTTQKISLLTKAVTLDPAYQDAHRYLGFCLLQDHQYQAAVDHLKQVKTIKSDQAFSYYHQLAFALLRLKQFDDAQKAAEAALQYARYSQETAKAQDLLHSIADRREHQEAFFDQPSAPAATPDNRPDTDETETRPTLRRPESVDPPKTPEITSPPPPPPRPVIRGVVQQIDCVGSSARLRILSEGHTFFLSVTNPQDVTVKGSPSGTLDLVCGPQKPNHVVVEYETHDNPQLGTTGVIRSMEFQ